MGLDSTARRRWLGGAALVGAAAMLIAGQTVLQSKLKGYAFIIYWLGCFLLTGLSILVAFWDLRALRNRTRQQHRDLLQTTLKKIETDARNKHPLGRRPDRQPGA